MNPYKIMCICSKVLGDTCDLIGFSVKGAHFCSLVYLKSCSNRHACNVQVIPKNLAMFRIAYYYFRITSVYIQYLNFLNKIHGYHNMPYITQHIVSSNALHLNFLSISSVKLDASFLPKVKIFYKKTEYNFVLRYIWTPVTT